MTYRKRTSRLIARRHDLNHFKYTPGLRKVQLYATIALLLVVAAGLAVAARQRSARLFAAGPISSAHSQFANDCGACHTWPACRYLRRLLRSVPAAMWNTRGPHTWPR